MKRYCVSQVGSNVIYAFSTPEEADEHLEVLGGKGLLWFVQANDSHFLPGQAHRLLRFEKLPTMNMMRAHGQESLCLLEI
jgi:hypothetical protein